jgi:hypothetical protein
MRIVTAQTTVEDLILDEYLAARAAAETANQRLEQAQQKLLAQMAEEQQKTYKWSDGSVTKSISYAVRSVPVIDEAGLRKALKAPVYDKFTVRKLDRSKLEQAMSLGEVDPVLVSQFTTMKPSNPYLTYRESSNAQEL